MLEKAKKADNIRKYYKMLSNGKLVFSDTYNAKKGFTGLTDRIRHLIKEDPFSTDIKMAMLMTKKLPKHQKKL